MRKLIALLLAILMLCGCSAGGATTETTKAPEGPDSITIDRFFTLVTPKKADVAVTQAAECMQSILDNKMKLPKLKIVNEDPGSNAIVFQIDNTMEEGAHKVELKGTSIYITAHNPYALLLATQQLRQLMLDNDTSPVVTKEMCQQLDGKVDMANLPFRFLSQNILFKDLGDGNDVVDRQPRFKALMQEYTPDILAVQEHSGGWAGYIKSEFDSIYEQISLQGLAFYFRKARYEVLESGGFYLSPTPNIKSQFEGDSGPRSCIWALATDKYTDTTFLLINCHPDWNNDTQRALQVEVIFQEMGEKMNQYPTIFCGDFNTVPDGPVYPRIVQDMKDTRIEAPTNLSEIDFTSHGFGASSNLIDYIFYNGCFQPTTYRILNELYGGYVSDHYAVMTDFKIVK